MRLIDIDSDRVYTLSDLHRDWQTFRAEDPYNHADDFTTELFVILMDTVNDRNNCDIVGLTPTETCNYILALRDKIERRI